MTPLVKIRKCTESLELKAEGGNKREATVHKWSARVERSGRRLSTQMECSPQEKMSFVLWRLRDDEEPVSTDGG